MPFYFSCSIAFNLLPLHLVHSYVFCLPFSFTYSCHPYVLPHLLHPYSTYAFHSFSLFLYLFIPLYPPLLIHYYFSYFCLMFSSTSFLLPLHIHYLFVNPLFQFILHYPYLLNSFLQSTILLLYLAGPSSFYYFQS